jgi:hypothetical protein
MASVFMNPSNMLGSGMLSNRYKKIESAKYIAPGDTVIKEIIETTIRARESFGTKYHGGAVARIMAQLPKVVLDKETFVHELEEIFKREERYYT